MFNVIKILKFMMVLALTLLLSQIFVYAGAPAPPPPPCQPQYEGCYTPSTSTDTYTEEKIFDFGIGTGKLGCKTGYTRIGCEDMGAGTAHGCNETTDGCLAWAEYTCFNASDCNGYEACRITCRGEVSDYTKANFGELSTDDFGFYIPETRCKKTPDCACGQLPDPEKVAEQKDPDDSSGSCACIQGTEWNSGGKCCGDDKTDCGKISTGILCSIDENLASSQWLSSSSNLGDIRYVGCSDAEFLSDGKNWIKCYGAFWRKTISKSEYVCIGKGRESIVECCGDDSCKSKVDGKGISTGQSVNPAKFANETLAELCTIINKDCEDIEDCNGEFFTEDQCSRIEEPDGSVIFNCEKEVCGAQTPKTAEDKTYYCAPDKKFVIDLDVPNSQLNNKALINKLEATCEKAGFAWTGTKCCSEADDPEEYYNDIDEDGGCWNKEEIINFDSVKGTNDSVVIYGGQFHGCAVAESNFNKDNDELLNIPDSHTGGPLIKDEDYCTISQDEYYYCSYTEKWIPTDFADRTHLSFAPIESVKQIADCCAEDECWDGEKCAENQKDNPLSQPINGSRCIDGEWTNSMRKCTPDDNLCGYCPKETQCLSTVAGVSGKTCIESGDYIEDNNCENGKWTSRTKLLALKLLNMKSNEYALFCDSRENALNNLQYLTDSKDIVANVLADLQTNNFCILKSGGKVIGSTSINKNLEDAQKNSMNIFGVTDCSKALIDDGQYHSCDATNKVWYNKRLKSFIYSSAAITVPLDEAPFEESIKNPIQKIIDAIKRLIISPPLGESYVTGIKKFDKIYMLEQGSQAILGSVEGKDLKNAVIEYRNFDTDMCKFIDQFNQARKNQKTADLSGILCKKEGNNYYILVQGSQFTNINPESIWTDLTAKLRLK